MLDICAEVGVSWSVGGESGEGRWRGGRTGGVCESEECGEEEGESWEGGADHGVVILVIETKTV